jgi:hypothetical protein
MRTLKALSLCCLVWETTTGKPVGPVLQHGGGVNGVAFGPDGKFAVTASCDNTARVWNLPLPWEGSPELIALSVTVLTGMEVEESGTVPLLDPESWRQRRQLLFSPQNVRQMMTERVLLSVLSGCLPTLLALTGASAARADEPAGQPPAVFDLCKFQSSFRNQGERDVCPYFPPVAALEAAYRHKGIRVDLSEAHLIWLRNVTGAAEKGDRDIAENLVSTLGGGNSQGIGTLRNYAICRSRDMPYRADNTLKLVRTIPYYKGFGLQDYEWSKPVSQFELNRWNLDYHQLPAAARANAKYAIEKFESFPPPDLKNPRKFEEALAAGHEIVFGLNLHGRGDDSAIGEPVWRFKPGSNPDTYHFMLMVGYDRNRKFFVVKNQWGPTNFSAMKGKLAPGWKDIVRYDGYTLVDYNYLSECLEAYYVSEVAEVGSPKFASQRALGQWQVTFKHDDKPIMTGVLCWRRLPNHEFGRKQPDLRIGDLVTKDGQQFRVNAMLDGDGTKPFGVTIYIDFATGAIPINSTKGATWKGTLTLPENGGGSLQLKPHDELKQTIWSVPAADVEIVASLVDNKNLLKGMAAPK